MRTIRYTLAVLIAGVGLSTAALAQNADKAATQKGTQTTTQTTAAKGDATTAATGVQKGDRASYRAARKQADAVYKGAKAKCDSIGAGSIGKENCIGIARAERNYSRAQAMAQYRPTEKNARDVKVAAVNVEYARAKAKCESMGGNVKETGTEASLCMARANDARNQALAAAKAKSAAGTAGSQGTMDKARSATGAKRGDVGQER